MKEFTFGMLTYNQEAYVFECLESIKYQILNYGKNVKVYFVLSDDASKDNTVKYVEMWLEANKKLFEDIKIIVQNRNNGIVANYLTLLSNIHTGYYKTMAGDDLYYKNNVFDVVRKGDFVITPTIYFGGNNIIYDKKRDRFKILLLHYEKGNLKEYLGNRLRYSNCMDAPGVFINHKLVTQGLVNELEKYQWIEDVPKWNYLFNVAKVDVELVQEPYILYRSEVGISKNKNHSARSRFEGDVRKIEQNIYVDKSRYPRIINPYSYRYKLEKLMFKFFWSNSEVIKNFKKMISVEEIHAEEYLLQIIDNACGWKEKCSSSK